MARADEQTLEKARLLESSSSIAAGLLAAEQELADHWAERLLTRLYAERHNGDHNAGACPNDLCGDCETFHALTEAKENG